MGRDAVHCSTKRFQARGISPMASSKIIGTGFFRAKLSIGEVRLSDPRWLEFRPGSL
jgi:hypothetical protein